MIDQESASVSSIIFQSIKALALGCSAFILVIVLTISIFHLVYIDRIFPGLYIEGFYVGGMTVEEAAVKMTQHFNSFEPRAIQLNYLDSAIVVDSSDIGFSIDEVRTAIKAHDFGRRLPLHQWLHQWLLQQPLIIAKRIEYPPVMVLDQNSAWHQLQEIARAQDIPAIEAKLELEGAQVIATQGQIGRTLDKEASLENIVSAVISGKIDTIDLVVSENIPTLLDATPYISDAQAVLNQPFVIAVPEGINANTNRWTLTPNNLAPMLTFISTDDATVSLKPQFTETSINGLLASIAEQIDTSPENPRFIFNDETLQLDLFIEGIPGIAVDLQASKTAIQSALAKGENQAFLVIKTLTPEVSNNATGKELGITELVHVENSYFYGSDNARIQNIETAANEFLGILVKPGETFSMASTMGDISLDTGYSEALIIYDGRTIEGVGGGVCQVSTTLFRTAFFAGFPINERHPHAYRVSYYEKVAGNNRNSDLAGLDATVYIPLVDFKFTNDTPYWLLMEAYVNRAASRITWKFYSTNDGRTMEWQTTGLTNRVEPKKPLYILNDGLDSGEIKQVDWEAEGADVTVRRVVYKEGEILFEDAYFTRYAPWRAVYEYGPGTDGIPDQNED
jgi:vancomycin resistance protein YoaR